MFSNNSKTVASESYNIEIENHNLVNGLYIKYFGMYIDVKLSWEYHAK